MLEAASQVDTVVFDKTGTLTQGRPCLQQVLPAPGCGLTAGELLTYAAAVERCTSHPVAQAIVQAADQSGLSPAALPAVPPHLLLSRCTCMAWDFHMGQNNGGKAPSALKQQCASYSLVQTRRF